MVRQESFIKLTRAIGQLEDLTLTERVILAEIIGFCQSASDGCCYSTATELGSAICLNDRVSRRVVASLETRGYIIRDISDRNHPKIKLGSVQKVQSKKAERSVQKVHTECTKSTVRSVQKVHTECTKSTHPFLIEDNRRYLEDNRRYENATEKVISEEEKLFLEFWELYPKKVDKKGSLRAFKNIPRLKKVYPDIISALKIQKNSRQWKEQNGRFIPNPTTYIHQERWASINEADAKEDISQKIAAEALKSWGWIKEGEEIR